jgi:LPS export ABC transporter protein LptC
MKPSEHCNRAFGFFSSAQAVGFAAVLVIFCLSVSACERESSAGLIKLEAADSANHYSIRPVVQFMDSSFMRAKLTAGWARMYDRIKRKHLGGGLNVEFYSRPYGLLASVLTADSAVIEDDTKNMTARGNVVVTSERTLTTVKTSTLIWDNARNILRSDEFVDITSPTERLQGYGFESDPNLQHYTIYKVTGQTLLMGGAIVASSGTLSATTASALAPTPSSAIPSAKVKSSTTSIIQR